MSAEADGWEVVTRAPGHRNGPQLTVYADGNGYVNAAADEVLLGLPDACRVLVDADAGRLALDPVGDDDPDGYAVTRSDDSTGGDIRLVGALGRLGVDVDELDESEFLTLEAEGDLAVADCDPLFAATRTGDRAMDGNPAADDADDESEAEDEYQCRHCPDTFDSIQGRNIHEGRVHKGEDDADDDDDEEEDEDVAADGLTPDEVELPGSLTEGDVHAVADFLPTLDAVASDFEVEPERAERILRAYGCLDEVDR